MACIWHMEIYYRTKIKIAYGNARRKSQKPGIGKGILPAINGDIIPTGRERKRHTLIQHLNYYTLAMGCTLTGTSHWPWGIWSLSCADGSNYQNHGVPNLFTSTLFARTERCITGTSAILPGRRCTSVPFPLWTMSAGRLCRSTWML